jgi:hypothetical protein
MFSLSRLLLGRRWLDCSEWVVINRYPGLVRFLYSSGVSFPRNDVLGIKLFLISVLSSAP